MQLSGLQAAPFKALIVSDRELTAGLLPNGSKPALPTSSLDGRTPMFMNPVSKLLPFPSLSIGPTAATLVIDACDVSAPPWQPEHSVTLLANIVMPACS